MAGHSQFKNIMYRKGAQDAKRAKVFTKIIRELTAAAKMGLPDPDSNPRLRTAIQNARAANMPKDNIERAIKKGADPNSDANFEEMRYEGYGPGGVGIIVDALTDNRNRTASELRATFSRHGGAMGETGSVSYQFDRVGVVVFAKDAGDGDTLFEAAVEAGADDVESNDEGYDVICDSDALSSVRDAIAKDFAAPLSVGLAWRPQTLIELDEDKAQTLLGLIEALEDNDDVQKVSSNASIEDDILQKLAAQ